ncbi:Transmembrane protein [Trema orientale]|uniref:Transmembrane protein n=1 Tax=Trema orientale TaxID=63057 RepID=A0A2P5EBS4_TREOI|nr:Transmembrane protein [Trema orientale]
MSITCSCLLLFFLLCLSLHACNGRRLGAVLDKVPEETFRQFSSENREGYYKSSVDDIRVQPKVMKSSSSMEAQTSHDKTRYDLKDMTRKTLKERSEDEGKGKGWDAVRTSTKSSVVSVSWRVPHKKRGEKQPGFNLDYSPPKTHPPSHN